LSDPQRILIVRTSHLGDVVCALGVYHALRERWPAAELAWVVQPEFADLVRGLEGIRCVFRFGRKRGVAAWIRLCVDLRRFRADLAVDAQGNLKSAGATLCSGASRRVGLHPSNWRERAGAWVVNEHADAVPPERPHAIERTLELARRATGRGAGELDADGLRTDPELSAAETERGERLCDRWLPRDPAGASILHLAAPGDVRSWPVVCFRRTAELLAARGRGVLLLSGPGEDELGQTLRVDVGPRPGLRHWVGQTGLRDLAAFFTAAARRGARLVACDSGPMHLAAACGLPVTVLAGPQDAERTGPWHPPGSPTPHRVLRAADPPDCAPCLARSCTHPRGNVCMTEITPERVVDDLLRGERSGAARTA